MLTKIVSSTWLNQHWDDPDLIILDASLNNNKSNLTTDYPNIQIKNARFFDLKGIFSDQYAIISNNMLSPNEFTKNCRQLGINKQSKLVVYDNLGIYSSPRVWWMFKTMGHSHIAVLDGGLPAWIKQGYPTEERKRRTLIEGNFEANYQVQMVIDAPTILDNINQGHAGYPCK